MEYSTKSLSKSAEGAHEPLAGRRVLDVVPVGKGDLSGWLELMEAVEALCPVCPLLSSGCMTSTDFERAA